MICLQVLSDLSAGFAGLCCATLRRDHFIGPDALLSFMNLFTTAFPPPGEGSAGDWDFPHPADFAEKAPEGSVPGTPSDLQRQTAVVYYIQRFPENGKTHDSIMFYTVPEEVSQG